MITYLKIAGFKSFYEMEMVFSPSHPTLAQNYYKQLSTLAVFLVI